MKARSTKKKARRDGLGAGKGRKTRKAPLVDKAVGHIDDRPHEPIVKAFKEVYDWAKQEIDEFARDFIEILETAEVTQSDEAILRAGGYQSVDVYSWNKPESNKPAFWLDPEGEGYESCFQYRLEEEESFEEKYQFLFVARELEELEGNPQRYLEKFDEIYSDWFHDKCRNTIDASESTRDVMRKHYLDVCVPFLYPDVVEAVRIVEEAMLYSREKLSALHAKKKLTTVYEEQHPVQRRRTLRENSFRNGWTQAVSANPLNALVEDDANREFRSFQAFCNSRKTNTASQLLDFYGKCLGLHELRCKPKMYTRRLVKICFIDFQLSLGDFLSAYTSQPILEYVVSANTLMMIGKAKLDEERIALLLASL